MVIKRYRTEKQKRKIDFIIGKKGKVCHWNMRGYTIFDHQMEHNETHKKKQTQFLSAIRDHSPDND